MGREVRNKAPVVIPAGGAVGKGISAVIGNAGSSGPSRDSRDLGKLVVPFTQTEDLKNSCMNSNSNSRALMNPDAPRPPRKTHLFGTHLPSRYGLLKMKERPVRPNGSP